MGTLIIFLQLLVAFGLLNVWLFRFNRKTPYRGCGVSSLKEEFIAYGLPLWFFYFIGVLKVGSAFLLLLGLWIPSVVFPAAFVISILMIGAIAMHLKVRDPWKRLLPAFLMLILSLAICWIAIDLGVRVGV